MWRGGLGYCRGRTQTRVFSERGPIRTLTAQHLPIPGTLRTRCSRTAGLGPPHAMRRRVRAARWVSGEPTPAEQCHYCPTARRESSPLPCSRCISPSLNPLTSVYMHFLPCYSSPFSVHGAAREQGKCAHRALLSQEISMETSNSLEP